MNEYLQNVWQMTRGARIQLVIAVILICTIGTLLLIIFGQPNTKTSLTPSEKSYPKATPQPFRHQEKKDTGTLVVTSSVEGTIVLLDASDHPDPQDPIPSGQLWPKNTTPFTVTDVPIGKHVLFAAKPPRYDTATVTFEIKKDQVTRVHIELIPLRTSN